MAQGEIKIGEINSYSLLPAFTEPYRKGWQLAVEEINAAGGINGKKLVVVSKDDGGKPADAQTAANELVSSENVAMLTGTFLSNIGLAVTDFRQPEESVLPRGRTSDRRHHLVEGQPLHFPPAALQLHAGGDAGGSRTPRRPKLPAKRWATIAPNYEYGQSAVAVFKKLMSEKRPDIQWVDEQWPPQGKIDAGPVVQALAAANPEAILNVTFGADLVKLVREGNTRGLFKGREVVSFLTGEPEYLDPLKEETPEGWIVTGYPWYDIKTPEHDKFLKAYQAKFNDYPRLGSIVGYQTIKAAAAILTKAELDRSGKADRGHRRPVDAFAVRRDHLPQDRPPVDARRLCRQDRAEGRQGRDGGLVLQEGLRLPAERRRSREAAAEGLSSSPSPRSCGERVGVRGSSASCAVVDPYPLTRTRGVTLRSRTRSELAEPSS